MSSKVFAQDKPPLFDRGEEQWQPAARIGDGEVGGKAAGLVSARRLLDEHFDRGRFPDIVVDVPRFVVLTTEVFDAFMERDGLDVAALSGEPDDRIAHAFQNHDFPLEYAGDLRAFAERTTTPIAVRSSSLLEDELAHPFAGVYETKMIPNNPPDSDTRFQKLVQAIKYVYASMYFRRARTYLRTIGMGSGDEKMAVILQEVVGNHHGDRYYPGVSGVARSYNYYAFGRARPADGVVDLALGLGKTVVDGGVVWQYCPVYPRVPPPFGSVREQVRSTQTGFWAVNMGTPPAFDPVSETEYLGLNDLVAADYDGVLRWVASTYDAASDRMLPGVRTGGAHVVNFAPLLEYEEFPVNDLVRELLKACESAFHSEVEVEFAVTLPLPKAGPPRFSLLQMRPMAGPGERVDVPDAPPAEWRTLVSSDHVMGNGVDETIRDVVYVKPGAFELRHSRAAASQIDQINQRLIGASRPYLLIGFGRWGSSDPWLGIPVTWSQISRARAIVEAAMGEIRVDPSQGSHFFHNLSSFGVSYFTVRLDDALDWGWLDSLAAEHETELIRHVRLPQPLRVLVDGRSARGLVLRPSEGSL